jgi:alkaline phosphatase D
MIGFAQEAWLDAGLARSKAQWNLIAQDVLMAQLRQKDQSGNSGYWTDDWDGYPAGRRRLLQRIAQTKLSNPVVIGGDIHAFFANDLRVDFDNPNSPVVATKFVGTSVTSAGRRMICSPRIKVVSPRTLPVSLPRSDSVVVSLCRPGDIGITS